ncbi:MAG: hypothetical protein V4604_11710 [Bacteroidota bacterium]
MEFDNTSQEIWEEMQAGTPFSGPKRDEGDDYKEDFYGESAYDGIDLKNLIDYIIKSTTDGNLVFNWKKYAKGSSRYTERIPMEHKPIDREVIVSKGTPFVYKNEQQQEIVTNVSAKINRRIDLVSPNYSYWITIDPSKKHIHINYRVFYAKTAHKREYITETESPTDFNLSDKYAAIILETSSLVDFYYLFTTINNTDSDKELIKKKITEKIAYYLKRTSSGKGLDFLYRNIPEIVMEGLYKKLGEKLLMRHLYILKSFDENSNVLDSSGSLITLLRLLCQKDASFLLEVCKKHPQMVKELYINMDDSSLFEGNLVPNRSLLVNLIYALCMQNGFKDLKKIQHVYRMGKKYFPDSNVLSGNDTVKDKIFLKQYYRKVTRSTQPPQESGDDMINFQPFESITTTIDIPKTNGEYYYPLDLVRFIDMEAEDNDPVWVPAILVKYFADTQEWKDIMDCVRVGADLLAILIGIATLGSGTPLMMALAVGDIGLSVSDLWVALNEDAYMKTPEGREFLATWNKIMLLGGIVTAGPLLLDTAFTSGTKLFSRATLAGAKAETKNFLCASLMKIILEKNIRFSKNSLTILETGKQVFSQSGNVFKILQITELQKAGVIFAKLQQKVDGKVLENGFAVFYRGEMLAMGEAKKVREALKKIWGLKGTKLMAKLDEMIRFNKYLPKNGEIIHKNNTLIFNDTNTKEMVGLVEVNDGFLEFAIYRKNLTTKISGKEVFDSLIEQLRLNKINYKGIRGLWGVASDNNIVFNQSIKKGMNTEEAAFKTWTGQRAKEKGFTKVKIDKLVPDSPPYKTINVTFYN